MTIYRIKKNDASILKGLRGLHILSHRGNSTEIMVIDHPAFSNLGTGTSMSILPKNCNTELVCTFFKKMHDGKITSESVKILKEYLQYTEKKDKNNEIKSDLKGALKEIFYGLFILAGSVAGFTLMLMGMATALAGWMSFLIIPIVVLAIYGVLNTLVGVVKFGFGIFSFGFRQNNTEKLLELENKIYRLCMPSSAPPPSYEEVVDNTMPATAPGLQELPTYVQAVNNAAELSMRQQTSPINIPRPALAHYSPHFFQHCPHFVSSNGAVNNNLPPAYSYRYFSCNNP
ncbi:MAG: hypothetical protein RJA83_611 [Pseudomonadota bacterium]|jgi:hypothetical protein